MIRKVVCTAAAVIIIAVIAWAAADRIAPGPTLDPDRRVEVKDLVINTPKDGDAILMTVIDDDGEMVYQYDGDLELWKGADGKCYAIIHIDRGAKPEQTKGANNE